MFKDLTPEETIEFKEWARKNYVPFALIPEIWHPVIRDECVKINCEATIPWDKTNQRKTYL